MIDVLDQIIEDGFKRKLVHNYTSTELDALPSEVAIDGDTYVNFGSCSYLGLEHDPDIKRGVITAVERYGTQFSSSRTYLSIGLYSELEGQMRRIYNRPAIVTASTTLGHLATIPVVVGPNDAVVLDLQVHSSVQMTVKLLKEKKIPVYVVKHNCMESLEKKIASLSSKHEKVWYFADGVYSMYGDYAPFASLKKLLDTYKKFYLYIDDAHGMGWTGEHGCGVAFSELGAHDKMILAVSLNKSYAAAGGCLIFPNEHWERKVRNCGATYIFSGPIQPPMLGAAIASAAFHTSSKVRQRQEDLMQKIQLTNTCLDRLHLPQYQKTDSPLFFIPVGLPKISYDIVNKMKTSGYFLNVASFPAVPMKKSGIRFMINCSLSVEQIERMLCTLQEKYLESLEENGSDCKEVARVFNLPNFHRESLKQPLSTVRDWQVKIDKSIVNIDQHEWAHCFDKTPTLSCANLYELERTFSDTTTRENKWDFYYVTIKDASGALVLKTLFTLAWTKDDMFASAAVSEKVEMERVKNPYFLSSKTLVLGTLITKGDHLYLNYQHAEWKHALRLLGKTLSEVQENQGATKIMLRDFYGAPESDFETSLLELGYTKFRLPDNFFVRDINWNSEEEYLQRLNQKYRYNVRKEVLKFSDNFSVAYQKAASDTELRSWYQLYEQVYHKSYKLNVFKLPFHFFQLMNTSDNYDCIQLYLANDEQAQPKLVGVMFSCKQADTYTAMIVGLDYEWVYEYNVYKQILYKTLCRAKELGCKTLDFGFTADMEKKKLGAVAQETYAFVQATEHLSHSLLDTL